MRTCKIFSIVLAVVLLLGTASACKPKSTGLTTIILADCSWDSQIVHNKIAQLIIENAFEGYRVETSTASVIMNWGSVKNNDVDLFIEAWTNNYPTYRDDLASGDIVNVGVLVPDTRSGLYVPRYVVEGDPARGIAPMAPTLRTVMDLHRYAHVFPDDENRSMGRIHGSAPGWTTDTILTRKHAAYGLDRNYNYLRMGSEATLFASLVSAYNLGQAWVGLCYEPSWVAGKLDLILLEDEPFDPVLFLEGRTAFASQQLMIVSSRDFPEKAPEIFDFLSRYQTGRVLISKVLEYMDDTGASYEETAIWFLRNNDHFIDEWLPAENARKFREYLATR